MDMNFIKECEKFYESIGINQQEWEKYDNANEFASKFVKKEEQEEHVGFNTSDHITVSEEIVESLINA